MLGRERRLVAGNLIVFRLDLLNILLEGHHVPIRGLGPSEVVRLEVATVRRLRSVGLAPRIVDAFLVLVFARLFYYEEISLLILDCLVIYYK